MDFSGDAFGKLFEYYALEMPYGTAKARNGDPYEWIRRRLEDELQERLGPADEEEINGSL